MARSIQHFKGTITIDGSYSEQNLYTVPTGKVARVTGSAMALPSSSGSAGHITTICGAPVQTAKSATQAMAIDSSTIDLYLSEGDKVRVGGKTNGQSGLVVHYGISVIEEDV